MAGIKDAAAGILVRAVELDNTKRYSEAITCYGEGVKLLLDAIKDCTIEEDKKKLRKKATEYISRAEQIKSYVAEEKEAGRYHEQVQIDANSTGHSYAKMFGHLLDSFVTGIEIDDPYIRSVHQVYNFIRFCELAVKNCSNLKNMVLNTGLEDNPQSALQQQQRLEEVQKSLEEHEITLELKYTPTLHDREIRLDTGWVIKIGRGLDYFKPTDGKFAIGFCDMDLRKCHETTVDIFHKKNLKTAPKEASE